MASFQRDGSGGGGTVPNRPSLPLSYDVLMGQEDTCSICLEPFAGSQVRVLSCAHIIHETCYQAIKANHDPDASRGTRYPRCPLCRNDMLTPPEQGITPTVSDEEPSRQQEFVPPFSVMVEYHNGHEEERNNDIEDLHDAIGIFNNIIHEIEVNFSVGNPAVAIYIYDASDCEVRYYDLLHGESADDEDETEEGGPSIEQQRNAANALRRAAAAAEDNAAPESLTNNAAAEAKEETQTQEQKTSPETNDDENTEYEDPVICGQSGRVHSHLWRNPHRYQGCGRTFEYMDCNILGDVVFCEPCYELLNEEYYREFPIEDSDDNSDEDA